MKATVLIVVMATTTDVTPKLREWFQQMIPVKPSYEHAYAIVLDVTYYVSCMLFFCTY